MAFTLMQRRRSGQPQQGTAIDRGNPIARGLAFLSIPQGSMLVNMVSGARGTLSGTTPPSLTYTQSSTRALSHAGSGATNSYVDFGNSVDTSDFALGPMTVFAWGAPTGQGGIAERNDNNSVNAGWLFGVDSNSNLKFLHEHSSTNHIAVSGGVLASGVATSMAVTYAGSGGALNFYQAGGTGGGSIPVTSGVGTPGSDAANSLYIGRNSFASGGQSSAGSFAGVLEFVAIWRRVLSGSEIAALHANRYQLFTAPSPISLLALGVAGPGGAATARPQVFVCT